MLKEKQNTVTVVTVLLVLVLVGGVYAVKSSNKDASVKKNSSKTASLGKTLLVNARQEGKPAYIFFHSSTCVPCKEMGAIVEKVMPEFKDKIKLVDIDVYDPSEKELISEYRVQSIPTSIFIDPSGKMKYRTVGVIPEAKLKETLEKLVGNAL